jgi:hypothetical protein
MSDNRGKILASAARLRSTLGSSEWLKTNRAKVSLALPVDWKRINDCLLGFGFALKLAGVQWTEEYDLLIAMQWLAEIGIAQAIKANGSIVVIRRATTATTH